MIVRVNLLALAGAEILDIDGEEGVFIPIRYNADVTPGGGRRSPREGGSNSTPGVAQKSSPEGRWNSTPGRVPKSSPVWVSFSMSRDFSKVKCDWRGRLLVPRKAQDAVLENPSLLPSPKHCIFGFENRGQSPEGDP